MRLLLDTHVAIWALTMPRLLSPRIALMIEDPSNEKYLSVASIWEVAIKSALKRGDAPRISASDLLEMCELASFGMLSVKAHHAVAVETLPPIHADPFDRMIIAQAKTEPMTLVTHDKLVARYDVNIQTWSW